MSFAIGKTCACEPELVSSIAAGADTMKVCGLKTQASGLLGLARPAFIAFEKLKRFFGVGESLRVDAVAGQKL